MSAECYGKSFPKESKQTLTPSEFVVSYKDEGMIAAKPMADVKKNKNSGLSKWLAYNFSLFPKAFN